MPSLRERWRNMLRPNVFIYQLGSDAPTQVLNYTAQKLYQTQDNLKACVDFLSNSIAQLPLKVYKRNGETDRERDRDSVASKLLSFTHGFIFSEIPEKPSNLPHLITRWARSIFHWYDYLAAVFVPSLGTTDILL